LLREVHVADGLIGRQRRAVEAILPQMQELIDDGAVVGRRPREAVTARDHHGRLEVLLIEDLRPALGAKIGDVGRATPGRGGKQERDEDQLAPVNKPCQ
jgi:hypothetical protein